MLFRSTQVEQIDQVTDLTGKVKIVSRDITNVKFKSEEVVSEAQLTTRLDKIKSDIDASWRTDFNTLAGNMGILDLKVSDVDSKTNEQFDQINSLANRVGIM